VAAFLAVGLFQLAGASQSPDPASPPPFKALRYDEDYRAFLGPKAQREPRDALKALPLPGNPDGHLTVGGDLRLRYEQFSNAQWGQGVQDDNGYLLQRYMVHADIQAAESFRVFTQIKSGRESGRAGGPRPTDEDRLDLHQAFLDVRHQAENGSSFTLRIGRQEVAFGSSRLISFREGPNVRLSFDGARVLVRRGRWSFDAFGFSPVQTLPGTFDDSYDRQQRLWGGYASGPLAIVPGVNIDVYYLGLRRNTARFDQGVARELRHSVGTRLWGKQAAWDYNVEFVVQTGEFGSDEIFGWTVASDLGYSPAGWPLAPRLGLKANIASGDRDPSHGNLQTFNALFPRGAYFSESGLIGPANFIDLHPSLTLNPSREISLTADVDFFWRQSTRDGLYGPAVNLVRSGWSTRARYVGAQTSLFGTWKPSRHWSATFGYAHFFVGDFLRESGPAADVDYTTTYITYTF
jgi:hypothetical protein